MNMLENNSNINNMRWPTSTHISRTNPSVKRSQTDRRSKCFSASFHERPTRAEPESQAVGVSGAQKLPLLLSLFRPFRAYGAVVAPCSHHRTMLSALTGSVRNPVHTISSRAQHGPSSTALLSRGGGTLLSQHRALLCGL